jgi:uncharacterized phage protein gp47/JayE
MARGRLESPNLDDRNWQDLVDQMRALIPAYAPQWTDHNPSDLGMTLIELFAWLVEGMIYRLNRVPDKNMVEFLNLIGITRDPATPASTLLVYWLANGTPPLDVPKGHQVATRQTEDITAITFETDEALRVLSTNLTTALYLYRSPTDNQPRYRNVTSHIIDTPLRGLIDSIPAASPPPKSVIIALGFDAATAERLRLRVRLSRPLRANAARVAWRYSRGHAQPDAWVDNAVENFEDGTEGLQKNGQVSFTVPTDWAGQNPADWDYQPEAGTPPVDQEFSWIGIRIDNRLTQPLELGIEHLLFNAVPATNALTITEPEDLGVSTSEAFQFFDLKHQPLYKQPGSSTPYAHLRIQVREPQVGGGFGAWTEWTRVEDFPPGPGNNFRVDPVTGRIDFGNYHPSTSPDGQGSIPPSGSEIRALTYRYVAGDSHGNVPPNTITVMHAALPGLVAVHNPGPATGGSDEEAVEETKRRAPEVLRNRDRAVTAEDYEYLAREATTDVQKVRCLPERLFREFDPRPTGVAIGAPWTFGGLNRDKGTVNVIIIPATPLSDRPLPSAELLQEVADYLDARRVVSTTLHITYPRYLPVNVTANVIIWQQAIQIGLVPSADSVGQELRTKITEFLHPLHGGPGGTGWEVGQAFLVSGLLEFIQPDPRVGFITRITVAAGQPIYGPDIPITRPRVGESEVWVQLADYEIICSGTHTVTPTISS